MEDWFRRQRYELLRSSRAGARRMADLETFDDNETELAKLFSVSSLYYKYFDISVTRGHTRGLLIVIKRNDPVQNFRKIGIIITNPREVFTFEDITRVLRRICNSNSSRGGSRRRDMPQGNNNPQNAAENRPAPRAVEEPGPHGPRQRAERSDSEEEKKLMEFLKTKVNDFLKSDINTKYDFCELYVINSCIDQLDEGKSLVRALLEDREYKKSLMEKKKNRYIAKYPCSDTEKGSKEEDKSETKVSDKIDVQIFKPEAQVLLQPKKEISRTLRLCLKIEKCEKARYELFTILGKIQNTDEEIMNIPQEYIKEWKFLNNLRGCVESINKELFEISIMHIKKIIMTMIMDDNLHYQLATKEVCESDPALSLLEYRRGWFQELYEYLHPKQE